MRKRVSPFFRQFILLTVLAIPCLVTAQTSGFEYDDKDYKDTKSHEHYWRRRTVVSAWQINELKKGALVVRLNTNQLLIDAFRKQGLSEEAERVRLEQAAANINIIRAYLTHYKFSKVYFIYSHSSDSLLKGKRSGIFLNPDLTVNPNLTMEESFYLIAERDYVYNSSIGFFPEDSARTVTERGNPSPSEFAIVIKNKFGHQLKNPFPFAYRKLVFSKGTPVVEMSIEGKNVPFTVKSSISRGGNPSSTYRINGKQMELILPRIYRYDIICELVEQLNFSLGNFYRNCEGYSPESSEYEECRPFFY